MIQNNFQVILKHTDLIDIDEKAHFLPPDKGSFEEFKVADYYCPEEWSKDGVFIKATEGEPLWFDFRRSNKYSAINWDCAVVCSVQKINPLTGERIDPEKGLTKDPKQNYLYLPEQLWLDSYSNDGKVYQFVVTKSGIGFAVNETLLPEFDRDSHALAFAFYRAKNAKPLPVKETNNPYFRHSYYPSIYQSNQFWHIDFSSHETLPYWSSSDSNSTINYNVCRNSFNENFSSGQIFNSSLEISNNSFDNIEPIDSNDFNQASMGAGGRIEQMIKTDDNSIDYYEEKPAAILKIYFCFEEQFNAIMKKGKIQDPNKKDNYIHSGKIGGIQIPLIGKNNEI